MRGRRPLWLATLVTLLTLGWNCVSFAQSDEIQVYTGEIVAPGEFSVTLHNNYTADGRKQADIPGGIVPDHALNGVPEFAYGAYDWLELGAYLPVYTVTRDGRARLDSAKLRILFAEPHAEDRSFFYAVNFELSYNARHWESTRFSSEMRPIVGFRSGKWDFIFNPIVDFSFTGIGSLTFAPAERIAYNFSPTWALAAEHYADYGEFRHLEGLKNQDQSLFAVVDYSSEPMDVEFGVGHGFTAASDALVFKLMLVHGF